MQAFARHAIERARQSMHCMKGYAEHRPQAITNVCSAYARPTLKQMRFVGSDQGLRFQS
jgi:hypothetical protein